MTPETIQQAWFRIFGTVFDGTRNECLFFANGWHAGRGNA